MSRVADVLPPRLRESEAAASALTVAAWLGLLAVLPWLIDVQLFGARISDWISLHILIVSLVWGFTAQSWNITGGYAGQFSFGHAAFFGIGAYTTMVLLVDFGVNPWVGMLVGSVVAMSYALLEGVLLFRYDVKGHFFALATLAFAEVVRITIVNTSELNRASGYYRPLPKEYGLDFGLVAFQFREDLQYYLLILAFLVVVTAVSWAIRRSAIGLYLLAIREDETAAASLGISPFRYKLFAMGTSAFFTAWGGAFWAMYFTTITPNTVLNLFRNVEILLPALLGGMGTVVGPIVGALVVTPLSDVARQLIGDVVSLDRAIFGVLLVFITLFNPEGLIGWPKKARTLLDRFAED